MCFLKSKFAWVAAPLFWVVSIVIYLVIWMCNTPEWINAHFDNQGISPVESATIGFFFLQIAFFWLLPPLRPGATRRFWLADFSLITVLAICRELDWHKLLIKTSNLPGVTHGTPFKLKFLTNASNPLTDRLIVFFCFAFAIALCGGTLLYFIRRLLAGLFKMHPVCWSMGFLGCTFILSQIFDRANSVLRNSFGIHLSPDLHALTTVLEEGQELLMPLFIILATLQAHFIYNYEPTEGTSPLARFKEL